MEQNDTAQPSTTMGDRLMNVFASPSDAFEGLSTAPASTSLWLVPMLVSMVVGILFTYLLFSNPTLKSQLMDMQAQGMEQAVKDGKMTQAQADRMREGMEGVGLGMFMVFGGIPVLIFVAVAFFGGALFLWLAGKFVLRSAIGYNKYLEVYGIAAWIGMLGSIVTMAIMIALDSFFARPALSLAVLSEFNPMNTTHKILGRLEVFALWQTAVIGIGLSKLTEKPIATGLTVAFVLWIAWVGISIALNIGG